MNASLSAARAILETLLYATGSWASEVVGLQLADLFLDSGFCKCLGKGNKQRVVPLGKPAITAMKAYLELLRPQLNSGQQKRHLGLREPRRQGVDTRNAVGPGQEVRERTGLNAKVSPHAFHTVSRHTS